MKRRIVFFAAILFTPWYVTAAETTATATSGNPTSAESAVASPPGKSGASMSPRSPGSHHRHHMKHGQGKHGASAKHGGRHHGFHQQVLNRLDLMDARLVKIEAMLERLMKR